MILISPGPWALKLSKVCRITASSHARRSAHTILVYFNRIILMSGQHFVGNEQEMHRNPRVDPDTNPTIEASSSNIDDRTMHEHYMWPFADAVHAGTASISTFSLTLSHLDMKAHPLLTALLPSVCIRETEQ